MNQKAQTDSEYPGKAVAWRFIILLGVISLLSDMTYEGARSITGPFLGELQASALEAEEVGPRPRTETITTIKELEPVTPRR